jgi:hypothetical protein
MSLKKKKEFLELIQDLDSFSEKFKKDRKEVD